VSLESADLAPGEYACEKCGLPIREVMVKATTVAPPDLVQGHAVAFHQKCARDVLDSPRYNFAGDWGFDAP
jgi:hypothetical protein